MLPDDLLHFHAEWDAKQLPVFEQFNRVKQPLLPLLDTQHQAVVAARQPIDSILNCYYRGLAVPRAVAAVSLNRHQFSVQQLTP